MSPDVNRGVKELDRVKQATVALAVMHQRQDGTPPSHQQPFTILGSGFCVHEQGVVVTCSHVIEAFMEKKIKAQLDSIPEEEKKKDGLQRIPEVKVIQPYALFFVPRGDLRQILVACVGVTFIIAPTDMDLGVLRLSPHEGFRKGFPTVAFEDFSAVHEGLELGICGFPLGNRLFNELGTVTSSFTRGIVSSIVPSAGLDRESIKGFQLDARATHGNSGGPVFSWDTGKVFGVLQSGVFDDYGAPLFSHAESIYKLLDTRMIESALAAPARVPFGIAPPPR